MEQCSSFAQDELVQKLGEKELFEIIVQKEELVFLGWRMVPVNPGVLGKKALELYAL